MEQQRKGQFLWNQISMSFQAKNHDENCQQVEHILWNMSNKEFDAIMKKYETNTQDGKP